MIKLIPYEPWHLLSIFDKQHEIVSFSDMEFLAYIYKGRGTAYTVVDDDKVIGCAGVMRLWHKVGEAWSFLTDDLRSRPMALHRLAKRMLLQIMDVAGYQRIQTTARADNPKAIRWVKKLGFEHEGTMKMFGPDKSSFNIYGMVN